jgi:hypothetical protein
MKRIRRNATLALLTAAVCLSCQGIDADKEIVGGKGDLLGSGEIVGVRLAPQDWARVADQIDARFVVDYGSFLWVEVETSELEVLRANDVRHTYRANPTTLALGGRAFDTRSSDPNVPEEWRSTGTAADLHLVQVIGPTKPHWLGELREAGLEVIQYISPHTYIVWGDATDLGRADSFEFVRWTQPFHPAFRVLPETRRATGDLTVLVLRPAGADRVVGELQQLGAAIRGRRALNDVFEVVLVHAQEERLDAIAHVRGVYAIHTVPRDGGLRGEMSSQVNVGKISPTNEAQPGYMEWLTAAKVDGTGVVIADVDSGVQDDHPDLAGRMVPCTGTTCGKTATSGHGTHTAGIMVADGTSGQLDARGFVRGLGVAPGAQLVEQVYDEVFLEPGGMLLLMTESQRNGAAVSGNSWGPAGSPRGYDADTLQVDIGARDADPDAAGNQTFTYVLSIMNGSGGISSQGSPDEAKNIITVGSTKLQNVDGSQILEINDVSSNSAHGPALDGRKIPHLVAPGCNIDSTVSGSSWTTMCGTSMASPQVTGAVALFIHYYRGLAGNMPPIDPSPWLIKAALLATALDLGTAKDADGMPMTGGFNNQQGWGRLDVAALVDPTASMRYFDNPLALLATGDEWTIELTPADPARPVRLMLVWMDAPGHGLGGNTPAWNNDLDLQIELDGKVYAGNAFGEDGVSVPGANSDATNNTEGVVLAPGAAPFTVRVVAANLTSDAVPQEGSDTDQDFALVCVNCK